MSERKATLTTRQRVFIEEYLKCLNATEAAEKAGYKHPNKQGPRLLVKVGIRELIQKRLDETAMSANEVLTRLTDMARGDMGEFLDISSMAFSVDLEGAKEKGITHLIKKVKTRTTTTLSKDGVETETHDIEIELYDAQAALVHLGRYHKLFTDKTDITSDGEPIGKYDSEAGNRAISKLADALGEIVSNTVSGGTCAMDATEQASMVGIPEQGG